MQVKVYYAHCMNLYGTPQEQRDVNLLEALDFAVVNPSEENHSLACENLAKPMDYFWDLVCECDVLAFRGLPGGSISSGVYQEILAAQSRGMPVIELPSTISRRGMSLSETREYLREMGQR